MAREAPGQHHPTPLGNKFDATAPKLQELLVPLKWTSTGTPIGATIAWEAGGIYKVTPPLQYARTTDATGCGIVDGPYARSEASCRASLLGDKEIELRGKPS